MENKTILVSGGAGYIGSHTVVELFKAGYQAIIVDDFRASSERMITGVQDLIQTDVKVYRIDICDKDKLEEIFASNKISGIIHFAALKAVGESVEEPLMYYRNNLHGLINMVELADKYGVNNFVFSSSCTVYGEPKGTRKVHEGTPIGHTPSPYGATKQMGERILQDCVNSSKLNLAVLSLRYFNPVGAHPSGLIGELPNGKPNNLMPFVTQTAAGIREKLTVFGNDYNTADGTCIRDFIHVVDLAQAHVSGLEWLSTVEGSNMEFVNLGTGKGTSVLEIINNFEQLTGVKLNWEFGSRREGDLEEIFAETKKAEELLGWKSKLTFKDAIVDAWNWEQKLMNE
ncbi:MAG: UDP-glucose 4-epimerase GalE [Crocinitomicaceae bacterium]